MAENYGFPGKIMELDADGRLNYFKGYTVAHHYLKQVSQQIREVIREPGNKLVILVHGPTGVGKTKVLEKIAIQIFESSMALLQNNRSIIPVAGIEAIAPDNGIFDWKDYYIRSLEELNEPQELINKKIDFDKAQSLSPRDPNRKLRKSLENAMKYRKLNAFFIDEAQNLTKVASARKIRTQIDTIKSLASKSGVPHFLFGNYDLLNLRNLSGQLSWKGIDIHFPRYRTEIEGDMEHFINTLWAFQKHLPFEDEPKLVDNFEFFYQRSIGCIGILKDWLEVSYRNAAEKKMKTLSMDVCVSTALSLDRCIKMIQEANEGELRLEDKQGQHDELLRKLGLDIERNEQQSKSRKRKNNRVGEQNPKRHKVGEIKDAQ